MHMQTAAQQFIAGVKELQQAGKYEQADAQVAQVFAYLIGNNWEVARLVEIAEGVLSVLRQ
jgi:hypothetical protein